MRKILFSLLILSSISYSQIGYVEYDHPIYNFLERMSSLQLIEDYDPFELPKTRREITAYLKYLYNEKPNLNSVDYEIFKEYLIEFEFDIKSTTKNFTSFLPGFQFENFLSPKDKYLYLYTDQKDFNLFVNLLGSLEYIHLNNRRTENDYNSMLGVFGGIIRGSILNNFGFSVKASNGIFSGDREAAILKNNLLYNYKFNENPSADDSKYFDETEGYFLAEFDFIKFKLGSDRRTIGYGNLKHIMSDLSPTMNYLSLDINYKFFTFSFLHGSLLGSETAYSDRIIGTVRNIDEKYIAYHRLGLNFGKHLKIGFGEVVIYGGRSTDLSYLNPFNFYKSVEHANRDRDNSQLFFDFSNNSIKGLKLYATLVIDDIDMSKLGTDWFGNQALFNFVIFSSQLNEIVPIDLQFQYLRIDPYFYTHRLEKNNYTNANFPIGSSIPPNSETASLSVSYQPHHRINITIGATLTRHGANELDSNGKIIFNHGGDIFVGHRSFDSNSAGLLKGEKHYYRKYSVSALFEPINNYFVNISGNYSNDLLRDNEVKKYFDTNLKIFIRI